jgi:chemotaxis protein MotB
VHKKKKHHEEHEEHQNHEAWVIPYADMLTLLMAMFLVLWAIGQVDVSKARAVSTGFADEFGLSSGVGKGAGGVGILDGTATPDTPDFIGKSSKVDKSVQLAAQAKTEAQKAEQAQLTEAEKQITEAAQTSGLESSLKFRMEGRGLVVSILAENVLFDAGSATIRPEGRVVLDGIAEFLASLPNQLSVEGHSDDRPISTAQFPSNWELSTARASIVLRYLVEHHGVSMNRISAAGYADQRPVVPNDSEGARAENRRVDIAILAENPTLITDEPAGAPNAADSAAEKGTAQ